MSSYRFRHCEQTSNDLVWTRTQATNQNPLDAWIPLTDSPGDPIVIPAGIYDRFTFDEADNLKVPRLSKVSGSNHLLLFARR
jgi:hypothetical protein